MTFSTLAACEDADVPTRDSGTMHDGGTMTSDGGSTFTDTGVECCPPSAQPGCCMQYGGAKSLPGACGAVCDGMPLSTDPAWQLVSDELGCPTWSSAGAMGPCCGSPPPPSDGGALPAYQCYGSPLERR